jgi:microcystin-dependent protein
MKHEQLNRMTISGSIPGPNTRPSGELWLNYPDNQLGYIDNNHVSQPLLGVRFFSPTANYNEGDIVLFGGGIYAAPGPVPAGPFDPSMWKGFLIESMAEAPSNNTMYGRYNGSWLSADARFLALLGGIMGGPLILNADPTNSMGAATKQYVDTYSVPVGAAMEFFGSTLPPSWLWCDGAGYLTTAHPALFNAIGYTYGGSGSSFNVPNAKQRVGVGADGTTYVLGQYGGANSVAIPLANLPPHAHNVPAHSHTAQQNSHTHNLYQDAHSHGVNNLVPIPVTGPYVSAGTGYNFVAVQTDTQQPAVHCDYQQPAVGVNAAPAMATDTQGSGAPLNIMQAYYVCNKIIKAG